MNIFRKAFWWGASVLISIAVGLVFLFGLVAAVALALWYSNEGVLRYSPEFTAFIACSLCVLWPLRAFEHYANRQAKRCSIAATFGTQEVICR